ncbi:MAG: leucine-rich repeat domain-containing protein [Reichenbachiella sp.]
MILGSLTRKLTLLIASIALASSSHAQVYFKATGAVNINQIASNELIVQGTISTEAATSLRGTGNIHLSGDFLIGSDWDPSSGSVALTGNSAQILQTNTFNNLDLQPGNVVQFAESQTTTMAQMIANGTNGDNISLSSTTPGIQASLDIGGGFTGEYLDIQDINITNGTFTATNSNDLGNNTGWGSISASAGGGGSSSAISQIGLDLDGEAADDRFGEAVSISDDGSIIAVGAYYNDGSGSDAGHVQVYQYDGNNWIQLGADIDGEAISDHSGISTSLSADGTKVAIGAAGNDDSGSTAGHVRIYEYNGSSWVQVGADIDGEGSGDGSGRSVSLSADGNRVAIGATGYGGAAENGQVRIFEYNGSSWQQMGAHIVGGTDDNIGSSVCLSADGNTVAVGADLGDEVSNNNEGYTQIFEYNGSSWIQLGLTIFGEAQSDRSGESVSLSADGSIIAIGAYWNDGTDTDAGHTRVYQYNGSNWVQLGSDIDGEEGYDYSGEAVSLSSDGNLVAIGAKRNEGNGPFSGHVRLFNYRSGDWIQVGSDIDGEAIDDESGTSVALSGDGSRVIIGAPFNDGNGAESGHVRIFAVPSPDHDALMALYNSTDGNNWTDNTGWGIDPNLENWHGVTTDGSGNVTELELFSNNLVGSIPAEIGQLSSLEILGLSDNTLSGDIPIEVTNLSNLLYLYLDFNDLTGTIFPEYGGMTNLVRFRLDHNELTGSIPTELGNLTQLSWLYLGHNQLTGEIPVEIGNLTQLNTLYLNNAAFTGTIPLEIGNLTGLSNLSFSETNLSGEVPPSIYNGNLTLIDEFSIDNSSICEPDNPTFDTWAASLTTYNGSGIDCSAQNLLAHYTFTGNANDVTANGLNGVVNEATLITDRYGNIDGAYDFNGTTSEITADISSISLIEGKTAMSVAFWVNPRNSTSFQQLVQIWPFTIFLNETGGIQPQLFIDGGSSTPQGSIDLNVWQHFVFTYNDGTAELFKNGESVGTATHSGTIGTEATELYIGFDGTGNFFDGALDEIRVYERALTENVVADLYDLEKFYTTPTVIATLGDLNLAPGYGTVDLNLSNIFEDLDGESLTYSAASSDEAVATVSVSSATLTITEIGTGTAAITVTADDGTNTVDDVFEVNISNSLDPWAHAFIGSQTHGNDVKIDNSGNVYTVGRFIGETDFGGTTLTPVGLYDVFLSKHNSQGGLIWVVKAGGTSQDNATSVEIDTNGDIVISGLFNGTATFGATNIVAGTSYYDSFIAKFDSNGNVLWANSLGTHVSQVFNVKSNDISINSTNEILFTSKFNGTLDFGVSTISSSNGSSCLMKYDVNGNVVWAIEGGGTASTDRSIAVETDSNDNIYFTGLFTDDASFDTEILLVDGGGTSPYIAKYTNEGAVVWAKKHGDSDIQIGTSNNIFTGGVKLDPNGNLLWNNNISSENMALDIDNNLYVISSVIEVGTAYYQIQIEKINSLGHLIWKEIVGEGNHEYGNGIAAGQNNNVIATGSFTQLTNLSEIELTGTGGPQAFLWKFNKQDQAYLKQNLNDTTFLEQFSTTNYNLDEFFTIGNGSIEGYSILNSDDNVITTSLNGSQLTIHEVGLGTSTITITATAAGGLSSLEVSFDVEVTPWVWAKNGGSSSPESSGDVAVDAIGNIYVTGSFAGTADFDTESLTSLGGNDIYVVKYDNDGNILWAQRGGGSSTDHAYGIEVDNLGNVYVAGYFAETGFFGAEQIISEGARDVFVAKYDTDGNLLWVRSGGGSGNDYGYDLALDNMNNVYVTGSITNNVTFGTENLDVSGENNNIFIVKYNNNGDVQWANDYGGVPNENANSIEIDNTGNIYLTGKFSGTSDFGGISLGALGSNDIFTAKYDSLGNLVWVKSGGSTGSDDGNSVGIDISGNVYTLGEYNAAGNFGGNALTSFGGNDIVLAKYDTNGNLSWVKGIGDSSGDTGYDLVIDNVGSVIITGSFGGTVDFGGSSLTASGTSDVYAAKYDTEGNLDWVYQGGGPETEIGYGITLDGQGFAYLTGTHNSVAATPAIFGEASLVSSGGSDVFVAKLTDNSHVANSPAVVSSPLPHLTVALGAGTTVIDLSSNFQDPEGDNLTFSATSSDEAVATVSISGSDLTITMISLGTTTVTVSAQDPSSGPVSDAFDITVNTGLLAHYADGGADITGNNHNMSVVNVGGTSNRFGYATEAFIFDGASAEMSYQDVDLIGGTNQISVSFWVNPVKTDVFQDIVNFGAFRAYITDSHTINAGVQVGSSTTPVGAAVIPWLWQHFVFTYDGASTKMFKNGAMVDEVAISGAIDANLTNWIGSGGGASFYEGRMDDVKLYNYALSDADILSMYNESGYVTSVAVFGNATGDTNQFLSNISPQGGIWENVHIGAVDLQAGSFFKFLADGTTTINWGDDGSDGIGGQDEGDISMDSLDPAIPGGPTAIRINTGTGTYQVTEITSMGLVGSVLTGADNGWSDASEVEMVHLGNGIYEIPLVELFDGEWKVRANGQWGVINWGSYGNTGLLDLISDNGVFAEGHGFYKVTVDIISKTYAFTAADGLVAYYPFNGNADDESENGNDASLLNGLGFTTDRFGITNSAVLFDGFDDEVSINDDTGVVLDNDITLNIWVHTNTIANSYLFFDSVTDFTDVKLEDVGGELFLLYQYEGGQLLSASPIPINEWVMLSVTREVSTTSLYINGVISVSEITKDPTDMTTPRTIGREGGSTSQTFNGSIDDISIYNRAISPEEIAVLYEANNYTNTNILTFNVPDQVGQANIQPGNNLISAGTISSTDLSALAPTFTLGSGVVASPSSDVAQDFNEVVTYTVTAPSGSSQDWRALVTKAGDNSSFTAEDLVGEWTLANRGGWQRIGDINSPENSWWYQWDAPDACLLDDTFTFEDDGTFTINLNGETQGSPWQNNDATYSCFDPATANAPYDMFSGGNYTYTTDGSTITVNGQGAYIGMPNAYNGGAYENTTAAVASSVTYQVYDYAKRNGAGYLTLRIQIDGISSWTYVLEKELLSGRDIISYSFPGQIGGPNIDKTNFAAYGDLQDDFDITDVVLTFELSEGATASVGGVPQVSGVTSNDFTLPLTYTVEAQDGSITDWSFEIFSVNQAEDDRNTLMILYANTDGDNWTNSWDTSAATSTWSGVTLDANGNVTRLDLQGNNLVGTLPSSIGRLSKLEFLNLSDNAISGSIPPEIGTLSSLETLWLLDNELTGSIPVEIGNLSSIVQIDISANQLDGNIPAEIGQLTTLDNLWIRDNNFTGGLPSEIGNLTNLSQLIAYNCGLSGEIPTEIGNLSLLIELQLSYNSIQGEIPSSIGGLTSLVYLDIAKNQLIGSIPAEIGNLTSLKELSLWENQISGDLPVEISSLLNLEKIDLGVNQLTGAIPSALAGFANLRIVALSSNNFNVLPDFSSASWANSTTQFEVQNNVLIFEDIIPNLNVGGFEYSPQKLIDTELNVTAIRNSSYTMSVIDSHASTLYQWRKDNSDIIDAIFADYTIDNVQDADAGVYTCVMTNPLVAGLTLTRNNINLSVVSSPAEALMAIYNATDGANWSNNSGWDGETADFNTWHGVTADDDNNVIGLDLASNGLLGTIPPEIGDLIHLTSLNLRTNGSLTGSIPAEIGNLTSLTDLRIDLCGLEGSLPSEIGQLTGLTYLGLFNTGLSGNIPDDINNLTNLQTLDLGGNSFTGSIPSLENFNNLEYLYLDNNNFTGGIPTTYGALTSMIDLILTDAGLEGAIPIELENLANLHELNLAVNNFWNLPDFSTALWSGSITTFNVSENELTFDDVVPNANINGIIYDTQARIDNILNESIDVGSNYTMTVSDVTSNNAYQWLKDNNIIDGATSSSYTIDPVGANDSGIYTCEITNSNATQLVLLRNEITLNVTGLDDEGPSIVVNADDTYTKGTGGITISVTVTDDSNIMAVDLFGGTITSETANGPISMEDVGNNTYELLVGDALFDDVGVFFYIEARDEFENLTTSDVYSIQTITPANTVSMNLSTGTTAVDYGIVSVPYVTAPVTTILSELGQYDPEKWRLFHYNGSSNQEYGSSGAFTSFEPGKGYWLLSASTGSVSLGQGVSVSAHRDSPFEIVLRPGWNMIGNPYPGTLNWNDVLSANGRATDGTADITKLVTYSRQYDENVTNLPKFRGAFVNNTTNSNVTFIIPVSSVSNAGGKVGNTSSKRGLVSSGNFGMNNWLLGLNLEGETTGYNVSKIGMNENANDGLDYLDLNRLPHFDEFVDISFASGTTTDFTEIKAAHEWTFNVNSTYLGEQMNLKWNQFALQGSEFTLLLHDLSSGQIIDMSTEGNLSFTQERSAQSFKIYFGPSESIWDQVDLSSVAIGSPYPNPFGSKITIPVTVPDGIGTVHFALFDVMGRKVANHEQSVSNNFENIELDLSQINLNNNGSYILRVQVDTENNSFTFNKRVVFIR